MVLSVIGNRVECVHDFVTASDSDVVIFELTSPKAPVVLKCYNREILSEWFRGRKELPDSGIPVQPGDVERIQCDVNRIRQEQLKAFRLRLKTSSLEEDNERLRTENERVRDRFAEQTLELKGFQQIRTYLENALDTCQAKYQYALSRENGGDSQL